MAGRRTRHGTEISACGAPQAAPARPTEEALAEYRAALDRLMARCLERLAGVALAPNAEPLETWGTDD